MNGSLWYSEGKQNATVSLAEPITSPLRELLKGDAPQQPPDARLLTSSRRRGKFDVTQKNQGTEVVQLPSKVTRKPIRTENSALPVSSKSSACNTVKTDVVKPERNTMYIYLDFWGMIHLINMLH